MTGERDGDESSDCVEYVARWSEAPGRTYRGVARRAPGFTSVRPPYYSTTLVATTERPRTEQWMAPKNRERSMTYYRRQRE
eukprot:1634389-Prymnesium_polylepis.1